MFAHRTPQERERLVEEAMLGMEIAQRRADEMMRGIHEYIAIVDHIRPKA